MGNTFEDKQRKMEALFENCGSQEEKYRKIIELGQQLPLLDPIHKIPENKVKGCQSTLYLHTCEEGPFLIFGAESDALISAGLAAILIRVYSGETPETLLKISPAFLEKLGITSSLTPNRANGLYSIHLRMKQEALQFLVKKGKGEGT